MLEALEALAIQMEFMSLLLYELARTESDRAALEYYHDQTMELIDKAKEELSGNQRDPGVQGPEAPVPS